MAPAATFAIEPLGDYSLEEGAKFIGAWHHSPSDGGSDAGHLHIAFLSDDGWKPIGVCLTQGATGTVTGTVYGDAGIDGIKHQVARILSLDVDGRGWAEVGDRDQVVARLQRMFPGFRPVNWSNAYEAAAWCLISSRISMRQGQGVKDRMSRDIGHEVDVHGHRLWVFPKGNGIAASQCDARRTTAIAVAHDRDPIASRVHIVGGMPGYSTNAPKMHIAAEPESRNEPGSNNHAEYHGG